MGIGCLVLGAGQEVGKSCVVVTMGNKKIMFDCGMHMGFQDLRRYPDFSNISKTGDFTDVITCVIITHFHLDHIGALPYFTEVCGYKGPIYMTYPTKALAPLMLEDYRKVMVDRRGEQEQFNVLQILQCMKKVTAVDLKQTVHVDADLQIRAYYAGHVLGAAMFYVRAGDDSIVYTGDYNMTPDRHLGAAQIDRIQPDLLITESTYATTVRDSKRARERDFLKVVHTCVIGGGKVLIPVFAMGRAQELCILLDDYWERMNLKIPIYFSAGLTIQANMYYKLLISWTNQKVKDTYVTRNTFDFKHVSNFDRSQINAPGPCVLFATPGMISGGLSLEVFKQWAPSERNLITLPGYCVSGTVGHKLMSGKATRVELDKGTHVDVRCQIHQLSFSAHTDAKGIMDLVKHVSPRHVVLVHGEKPKMAMLKARILSELGIPSYDPANNETVDIPSHLAVKVDATKTFFQSSMTMPEHVNQEQVDNMSVASESAKNLQGLLVRDRIPVEGIIFMENTQKAKVLHPTEALAILGEEQHKVHFNCCCPIYIDKGSEIKPQESYNGHTDLLEMNESESNIESESWSCRKYEGPSRKKQCTESCKNALSELRQEPDMHHKQELACDCQNSEVHQLPELNLAEGTINMKVNEDISLLPSDLMDNVETRLSKGLATVLVIVYVISQIFPSTIDYLALIPGKTIPFAWNLLSAGYLEQSIFGLILSIVGLLFSGKLLEPIWAPKEFLKFIAVVNFFTSISTFITAILLFYVTRRESFLYTPLSGFHGVLSGFLVGVKQIMPDQEITVLGVFKLQAKWLPSLLVFLSIIISFLTTESMPYLPFVIFGTYGSWLYLRYLQRNPETNLKGDPSDEFAFSTFFPQILRPIVDAFALICEKIFCGMTRTSSEEEDGYVLGGMPLRGSGPVEACRRRERGARALEERLSTTTAGDGIGKDHSDGDASDSV